MTPRLGPRSTAEDVLQGRRLSEKSVLVTGCSSGIGFETARALSAHGARVLLACRTRESAEQTASRIRESCPDANLTPVAMDLASFASIRGAVQGLGLTRLDALVCNAGLFANTYGETEDGIERTVGICHFGHFLLTSLLLDALRAAAPARVVVVASESHRFPPRLNLERFPLSAANFRPLIAYGQAKLCNVLFANELTRRFASQGVYANSLHPGSLIGTSIFRESMSAKLLATAVRPFTKTVAQGAATSVYCTVAEELEGVGGRYYSDCRERAMSRGARDAEVARRLWEISERYVAEPPRAQVRSSEAARTGR